MSEAVTSSAPSANTSTTQGQAADLSAGADNKGATATQETAPTTPQKFKVKVAGEEREITSDEALKDYELRQASYKRMSEAAAKEKRAQEIEEMVEKDPIQFLKSRNKQARALAEKYLADELMQEMMSPEEKARNAIEAENKQLKAEKEEREAKEKADAATIDQQKAAKEIDTELTKALANTFLPKDEFTVSRIATTMINSIEAGVDMSYEDAVALTEQQEIANFRKGLSTLDGEKLLKYLGEETAEKIRKADIGRLKTNPKSARPVLAASTSTPRSQQKDTASPMSPDEYREFIESRRKTKTS